MHSPVDRHPKVVMLIPTMATRTLTILSAILFTLILGSAHADDADSNVTLKSDDGKVQLVMPPGWIRQKSSNPTAALEFINDDSDAFVMVVVIAAVSSYFGVRKVLRIEPFDIFRG